MKITPLKNIFLILSLFAGIVTNQSVMATLTPTPQYLGVAQNSVDVWVFTCPPSYPIGKARVLDRATIYAPLNVVQVVLGQAGSISKQVQDDKSGNGLQGGEGGLISEVATINGVANRIYVATFKKTLAGKESYIGSLYCFSNFGFSHNPTITQVINQ